MFPLKDAKGSEKCMCISEELQKTIFSRGSVSTFMKYPQEIT